MKPLAYSYFNHYKRAIIVKEKISIFDTTLRDGEQSPGASLNLFEKLEIAHQLAKLNVDVIEAGFPISSPAQFDAVHAIASEVDKIITGFSDGAIYDTKPKQKPKLIFKSSSAPIVSLIKIESKCLVVDYNGNLTFISISNSK